MKDLKGKKNFVKLFYELRGEFSVNGEEWKEVENVSLLSLLNNLYTEKFTGNLEILEEDGRRRTVFFKDGLPVFVDVNPPTETESIGSQLLKMRQQVSKEGKVSKALVEKMLTYQHEIRLYKTVLVKKGKFRLTKGTPPPEEYRLSIYKLLINQLKEKMDVESAKKMVAENRSNYFLWNTSYKPQDISTDEKEVRILTFLYDHSGERLLRDVLEMSPFSPSETCVFLMTISKLGLIQFSQVKTPSRHKIIATLKEIENEFQYANFFDILGVHWSSTSSGIEAGYKKKLKEFEIKPDDDEEIKNLKRKILSKIEEAYKKLSDREFRKAYRKEALEGFQLKVGVDLLLQKAEMELFIRENLDEAMELIESAADIMPEDIRARCALAFVTYRKFMDKEPSRAKEALKILVNLFESNPNSDQPALYMAKKYLLDGNKQSAIMLFKKALSLNPSNEEARRELRRLTGKAE